MAKEYEINCPYCKHVRKIVFAETLLDVASGIGMALTPISMAIWGFLGKMLLPKLVSASTERNWFDLKEPCPNCKRTFSFNIVTGESRE